MTSLIQLRQHPKAYRTRRRARMAAPAWKLLFNEIATTTHPATFGYNDLEKLTGKYNINITRNGLRAKMNNYTKSNYITRSRDGNFIIAFEGIRFFGLLTDDTNSRTTTTKGLRKKIEIWA